MSIIRTSARLILPIGSEWGNLRVRTNPYRIPRGWVVDALCKCGATRTVAATLLKSGEVKDCEACALSHIGANNPRKKPKKEMTAHEKLLFEIILMERIKAFESLQMPMDVSWARLRTEAKEEVKMCRDIPAEIRQRTARITHRPIQSLHHYNNIY